MKTFDYQVVEVYYNGQIPEYELQQRGREGWELKFVVQIPGVSQVSLIFEKVTTEGE